MGKDAQEQRPFVGPVMYIQYVTNSWIANTMRTGLYKVFLCIHKLWLLQLHLDKMWHLHIFSHIIPHLCALCWSKIALALQTQIIMRSVYANVILMSQKFCFQAALNAAHSCLFIRGDKSEESWLWGAKRASLTQWMNSGFVQGWV